MALTTDVLQQLKKSTLSPSANKKLRRKRKVWDDTIDIHVPTAKYKAMRNSKKTNINEQKDDMKQHNEGEYKSITIVHVSDTHNKHHRMRQLIPDGDVLVHSGDFVSRCFWNSKKDQQSANIENLPNEIYEFNDWIGKLPHKYKIVIAGNHECCFNELTKDIISHKILTNCTYLQDNGIEIYGLNIYGTPWTVCGNYK